MTNVLNMRTTKDLHIYFCRVQKPIADVNKNGLSFRIFFTSVFLLNPRNVVFFIKKLEDRSPFCGVTDTPVLDFWSHMPWVSKLGWNLSLACFVACTHGVLYFGFRMLWQN